MKWGMKRSRSTEFAPSRPLSWHLLSKGSTRTPLKEWISGYLQDEYNTTKSHLLSAESCASCVIHPPRLVERMKRVGTYNHLPRRTCFGTPPSEVARHVRMRLEFPSLEARRQ